MSRSAGRSPGRWLALVLSLGLLGGFALTGVAAQTRDVALIAPITLATGAQGKTIRCGCPVGPAAIAITPDGATAYVATDRLGNAGRNAVIPFTLATGKKGRAIPLSDTPMDIAISADGTTAYVASAHARANGLAAPGGAIIPITLATGQLGTPIEIGRFPFGIALTPDGSRAYVTTSGGKVFPFALANGVKGQTIRVIGAGPIGITPDGTTAYVGSGRGEVVPITLATGTKGKAINVGSAPVSLAITPNGKRAYVTTLQPDALVPITLATRTLGKRLHTGRGLNDIALTRDGKRAYVVP